MAEYPQKTSLKVQMRGIHFGSQITHLEVSTKTNHLLNRTLVISTPYVTTLPPISDTAGAFAGGLIMRADKNNAVYLLTITGPLTKVLFDGATSLSYQDFVKEFMNAYGIPEFKPNTEGDGYEYRFDNGVIISIAKDYTLQLEKAQSKEEIKSSFD
jgi:hypothetical protein